jgi:hypothetical protein
MPAGRGQRGGPQLVVVHEVARQEHRVDPPTEVEPDDVRDDRLDAGDVVQARDHRRVDVDRDDGMAERRQGHPEPAGAAARVQDGCLGSESGMDRVDDRGSG